MIESIFVLVITAGMLFIVYKITRFAAKVTNTREIGNLMAETLSYRIGNFTDKR